MDNRYTLSKSKLLSYLQCRKKLWLEIHDCDTAVIDQAQEDVFAIGHEVGEVSRKIYGPGHLISPKNNLSEALRITQNEMGKEDRHPLYEATFKAGGVLIRADVLLRDQENPRLVEVKASTKVKDVNIQDCAIQYWVMEKAGHPIESISVAHIDNTFVYQGDGNYHGLLKEVDVTEEILSIQDSVTKWVEDGVATLQTDMPLIDIGPHCSDPYDCAFKNFCSPEQSEYPISILPYGGKLVGELRADSFSDLREVPIERLSKNKHLRVWTVTKTGESILDPEAGEKVRALPYPRYYLDFETISFPVPIWAGTRPYQALPFQWSCHIENVEGEVTHHGYLAKGDVPPMREFIEELVKVLGDKGPIIVYSGYEAGILNALLDRYPDLENEIQAILGRLYDLLPLMRDHYYHPEMMGSWSIKKVLPTLAPELKYSDLEEVQDGGQAQNAFGEIISKETSLERKIMLRKSLEKYCELDTLAMVKIAHAVSI